MHEIGGYSGLCTLLCCSDGCLFVLEPVSVQDLSEGSILIARLAR